MAVGIAKSGGRSTSSRQATEITGELRDRVVAAIDLREFAIERAWDPLVTTADMALRIIRKPRAYPRSARGAGLLGEPIRLGLVARPAHR